MSTETAGLRAAFERTARASQYLVLATSDEDGRPWACPVWYATEDFLHYFWVSRPQARHSTNLAVRTRLAITIFDSRQRPGTGEGVYLSAVAAPVPEHALDDGLAVFSATMERVGEPAWTRADVTAPAQFRLYCATALERFVLSAHDERILVPEP
jgi:Pyridoxamine 5'-phosphate oxidase